MAGNLLEFPAIFVSLAEFNFYSFFRFEIICQIVQVMTCRFTENSSFVGIAADKTSVVDR